MKCLLLRKPGKLLLGLRLKKQYFFTCIVNYKESMKKKLGFSEDCTNIRSFGLAVYGIS